MWSVCQPAVLYPLAGLVRVPVRHLMHQRTIGQGVLREMLLHRLAEQGDRREILLGREILVANDEGDTVDDGCVEAPPNLRVDRLAEIDARHLRADMRRKTCHLHRRRSFIELYSAQQLHCKSVAGIRVSKAIIPAQTDL